jgi:hypothetical protein
LDIQPISSNKFVVELNVNDMAELDITYDDMDYSNIETRRVIWKILDAVRKTTGRDVDPSGNLMIEAAPDLSGGCLLMFTVPATSINMINEGTIISKSNAIQVFEFENIDNLLDVISAVGNDVVDGRIFKKGEKFRTEIACEKGTRYRHVLEEYGKFIGKDSLTVAQTHEHWKEVRRSDSK